MRIDRKKFVLAMLDKDINLTQLSEKSGVSRCTVTAVKTGKSCSIQTANALAYALGIDVETLIEGVN